MKIILSRKGFDGTNGGAPSPIFRKQDGTLGLYSLPIPHPAATCSYGDLHWSGGSLETLITSLRQRCRKELRFPPHLDPDLVHGARQDRHSDWRPIFGQGGGSESQLRNEGVGARRGEEDFDRNSGPLFLFFGWYGMTAEVDGQYKFAKSAKKNGVHALFGWLQVARKVNFSGRAEREAFRHDNPWAVAHPHVACSYFDDKENAIYIAPKQNSEEDRLIVDGVDTGLKASGMFSTFEPEIHTLTLRGRSKTNWRLPFWLHREGQPSLGMHKSPTRWHRLDEDPDHVHLESVDIGQEFVLDSYDYEPDLVRAWVTSIIAAGRGRQ